MKRKSVGLLVVLIAIAVIMAGCASAYVTWSATAIGAAADIYDIGMKTIRSVQDMGDITAEQREDINAIALIVHDAIKAADAALIVYNDALKVYKETDLDEDKVNYRVEKKALKAARKYMEEMWEELADFVNKIRPGTLPEKLSALDKEDVKTILVMLENLQPTKIAIHKEECHE